MRLLHFIITCLTLSASLYASAMGKPVVYQAKKGTQTVTIIGTLHVGVSAKNLPQCVRDKVKQASSLSTEIKNIKIEPIYFDEVSENLRFPDEPSVAKMLNQAQRVTLLKAIRRLKEKKMLVWSGTTRSLVDKMTIESAYDLIANHYPRSFGVMDREIEILVPPDKVHALDNEKILKPALDAIRPTTTTEVKLETKKRMLKHELNLLLRNPKGFRQKRVFKAYLTGDLSKINDINQSKKINKYVLKKRNFHWINKFRDRTRGEKNPAIAVGAGHLSTGDYSLLNLFKKRGFQVYRIDRKCKRAEDYMVYHDISGQREFSPPFSGLQ